MRFTFYAWPAIIGRYGLCGMNMQFSAHIRCIFAYLGLFAGGIPPASLYAWLEAPRAAL
jgi:hypothetical protein